MRNEAFRKKKNHTYEREKDKNIKEHIPIKKWPKFL
jgi:hypothetical protein